MNLKIVDEPISGEKSSKPRYRMAVSDGQSVRVRVVNADSPTFGADFVSAFRANVRRVRKENTLVEAAE
ncbi:MAG TPA: hypothetical protein VF695_07120 [Sphingomonas sp.]